MLHDGCAITTVVRNNSVMLTADRKRNDRIGLVETKGPSTFEATMAMRRKGRTEKRMEEIERERERGVG